MKLVTMYGRLIKQLAIRLGYQKVTAKSLVIMNRPYAKKSC